MATIKHPITVDSRFITSVMPDDLKTEMYEMLSQNPVHEEALWWVTRSEEDFEQIAYSMMNDDYLWSVWRETLNGAMREEMHHIKIREAEIATEHNNR